MKSNTLLSVVTFPDDLFYPVGVHTLGVFIKKGAAHKKDQKVVWLRGLNDGRWKKKGKRLEHPKAKDDYPAILAILLEFIKNQQTKVNSILQFQKSCEIDFSDKELQLVPEAYLDDYKISGEDIEKDIEQLMRENIAFRIKFEKQLNKVEDGTSR